MRYKINFDKTINQLVPYYLGGRKLILFLQSCIKPLQSVNDSFVEWAKETRIEASMTSQIFKFEWFLNRKFKKYFADQNERITIINGGKMGTPIYYQSATDIPDSEQFIIFGQEEEGESKKLYYSNELTEDAAFSFTVSCPKLLKSEEGLLVGGITEKEFLSMVSFYVNKYRISGKTYNITIDK